MAAEVLTSTRLDILESLFGDVIDRILNEFFSPQISESLGIFIRFGGLTLIVIEEGAKAK